MNETTKQVKIGAIISYVMIAINIVLGLVYTPWILRQVGSSDYGLYTIASSIVALFLMDFGMSAAVTRFVSNYRAAHDEDNINGFVNLAIKFYLVICAFSAILLTVAYFNIGTIYSKLTPDELESFKSVFIVTAVFVVLCFPVNICNGILNAFERFTALKGLDVFNKLGTVIVTIIALLLNGGVMMLIVVHGVFNLLTFLLKIWMVRRMTTVRPSQNRNSHIHFKEVFSFSAWSTANSISQQMIFNLMPSILAMVANTLSVTLYGFANVIEGYVYTITQAINGLFMPQVARLIKGEADAKNVQALMVRVGRLNQSVISLLIIGFAMIGQEFVVLWVGEEYSTLYFCILFLIIPYFVSASQQIANTSIIVLNYIKYSTIINIGTGIINLVSAFYVCRYFGVMGVCATIGILFVIRIIALNFVYATKLKIRIGDFFRDCHLKMLPGILLSAVISMVILHYMPPATRWLLLIAKGGVIVAVYAVVMWLIGWNRSEKDLFLSIIPGLKKRTASTKQT